MMWWGVLDVVNVWGWCHGATPRKAVSLFEDVWAGAVGEFNAVSNQLSSVLEFVGIGELWVFGGWLFSWRSGWKQASVYFLLVPIELRLFLMIPAPSTRL